MLDLTITYSNKARILHLASAAPGVHLRQVARLLGLSLHSVRYHVEFLSRSGLIICKKEQGYSRIFPPGTPQKDLVLFSLLRNNSSRKILAVLSSGSKLSNKEICEKAGLAKSTVSETIQKFLEYHLVQLDLSDSGVRIRLQDPTHVANLVHKIEPTINNSIIDNFIELWDF
jgi:predicted transcriptional regulator